MGLEKENERATKIRKHLPPGSGPYSVGCLDIMLYEQDDLGSFFRLYYPTEKTDIFKRDKQWPLWLPRKQYGHGYAYFLGRDSKIFGKMFNWLGGDVYIPALWQCPLCSSNNQFPVVVFSHGLGGNRTTNSTMCCELASQGFIVAAVEHRDGSASMTYHLTETLQQNVAILDEEEKISRRHTIHRSHSYSEEWKPYRRIEPFDDFDERNKQVHHRAEECIRVLEVLTTLNNGDEVHNILSGNFNLKQFRGRMDMSHVSVMGHSFGGASTVCTLSKDKRFRVGVLLDSWMQPLDEEVYKNTTQPVLMINMETFQWKKNILQMKQLESDQVERVMITLMGGCHQSVTDFQFIITSKTLGKFLQIRHNLSPKIAIDICNKATLGFFRKHLDIPAEESHEEILKGQNPHLISGTNVDLS